MNDQITQDMAEFHVSPKTPAIEPTPTEAPAEEHFQPKEVVADEPR